MWYQSSHTTLSKQTRWFPKMTQDKVRVLHTQMHKIPFRMLPNYCLSVTLFWIVMTGIKIGCEWWLNPSTVSSKESYDSAWNLTSKPIINTPYRLVRKSNKWKNNTSLSRWRSELETPSRVQWLGSVLYYTSWQARANYREKRRNLEVPHVLSVPLLP